MKEVSGQLKEAIESKDRDLEKMKSGVESVSSQFKVMEADKSRLEGERDGLTANLEGEREKVARLECQIEEHRELLRSKTNELEEVQKLLLESKKGTEENECEIKEKVKMAQKELAEANDRLEKSEKEALAANDFLSKETEKSTRLSKVIKAKEAYIAKLKGEHEASQESLEQSISDAKSETTTLGREHEEKLAEAQKALEEANKRLAQSEKEVVAVKDSLLKETESSARLSEDVEAKEAFIAKIKSEHEASLASLEQSISDAKSGEASEVEAKLRLAEERHLSELASRVHELDEMKRLREQDAAKLDSLAESLEATKSKSSESEAELERLHVEHGKLQAALKEQRSKFKSEAGVKLKKAYEKHSAELSNRDDNLKEIQRQRDEELAKVESLSKCLDEVKQKCSDTECQLDKMCDESKDLKVQLVEKSEEAAGLKSNLEAKLRLADERLSSELASKMQDGEEVKRLKDQDLAKIESLTKSFDEATLKCSESECQLDKVRNESQTLEVQLKDKSEEIVKLKSDVEAKLRLAEEKLSSEVAAKEQEVEEVKGLREQALAKVESTEHALAQSMESVSELQRLQQGQVDTLGEKCSLLEKDLREKQEHQETLESQMKEYLSTTEATTEALNRQLLSKEEELKNMRESLDSHSKSAKDSEELSRLMEAKERELADSLQKLSLAEGELAGVSSKLEKGDEMRKKLLAKAKELNKKLSKADEDAKASRAEGAEHYSALSDKLRSAAAGLDLELALTNGTAGEDNGEERCLLKTEVFVEAIGQVHYIYRPFVVQLFDQFWYWQCNLLFRAHLWSTLLSVIVSATLLE